ncbi:MAG TPA: PucR family transcriptional regulator ligand-binding domain-containing protein [Actinomycetes bacterium]|nr:PucR family transcriptional regulator ligand-binding domain-containing protein [Actinomycetes bacterium]
MPTSVADLLAMRELSLRLVAGHAGVTRPVRWAHVSELEDPTAFLRGGEILLTTGLGLSRGAEHQARYVQRLAGAGLAGLGLGLGFGFDATPRALAASADAAGFPVFEVPFEIPFIAITEALATRLVHEQYVLLQRASTVQQALSRLLLQGAGLQALVTVATRMTSSSAALFDLHGEVLALATASGPRLDPRVAWAEVQALGPDGVEAPTPLTPEGNRWLLPVMVAGAPAGFLVLTRPLRGDGPAGSDGPLAQLLANHVVTAVGLEVAKARAVAETERRLVGDFLDALLDGELTGEETSRRLRFLGLGEAPAVAVLVAEPLVSGQGPASADRLEGQVAAELARRQVRFATTVHEQAVVALFEAADAGAARALAGAVAAGRPETFGLGPPVSDPRALRRSYQSARYALRARAAGGQPAGGLATVDDLRAHRLLLAVHEESVVEDFTSALLGPLHDYDRRHRGQLVASVRAFLEHNGNWESAARALGVHRHTLRYRIGRAEELTGRSLSAADDRAELWLALRMDELRPTRDPA